MDQWLDVCWTPDEQEDQMNTVTPILAALLTVGCYAPALETKATTNPAMTIERLFAHDGCQVYRFYDNGTHYFVKCAGASASAQTESEVPCGKGCMRPESIATIRTDDRLR
jgi:hypothetical protein